MINENRKMEDKIYYLQKKGFDQTVDIVGSYQKGADLYFKKVANRHFILFSHYNKGRREYLQGFDCWEGTYKQGDCPGRSRPLAIESISLSFNFEKEWSIVSKRIVELENLVKYETKRNT